MPWNINAEIYPMYARSAAVSVATMVNWSSNLLVSMVRAAAPLTQPSGCTSPPFTDAVAVTGHRRRPSPPPPPPPRAPPPVASLQTFLSLQQAITSYGAFWLSAGVAAAGGALLFFILPETKGRSMEQIQELFQ